MLSIRCIGLVSIAVVSIGACSDGSDVPPFEVEPSFNLDSEDARQLVAAIEELAEADSFVLTVVTDPTADDDRRSVRMVYEAPDRASVETDRASGEDTLEFIDGSSILRPTGDEGEYLRYEIDVSDTEVEGVELDDVEVNVAHLVFSPLSEILDATDVEREGDVLLLTGESGDPVRVRLDGDGSLIEVVLIGPESRAEQVFTFSDLNAAEPVELPDDVTDFDDLPDCDEPRPISEAGPCQG